jgi:pimeloyl-ACP methyl ester carboxylesterase
MPYSPYTVAAVRVNEEYVKLSDGVSLKIVDFTPPDYVSGNPVVVFVAGWISLISGWQGVLKQLTPRYRTIYVETREKASARIYDEKNVDFTMLRMTEDIHELLQKKIPGSQSFYFVGSSLGSTIILDYLSRGLRQSRLAIVIGPNCEFHFPLWSIPLIKMFPPSLYTAIKPLVKWYLRNMRLDKLKEPEQVIKYEGTIDAAEPARLKKNALALKDYHLWDKLPKIQTPILIIAAKTDILHGLQLMEKMVTLMSEARLQIMASNKETHSERVGELMVNEIIHCEQQEM